MPDSGTISLFRDGPTWCARYTVGDHPDPLLLDAFGTATLPTAFPATTPAPTVLAHLQRLNPKRHVRLHYPDAEEAENQKPTLHVR